MLVGVICQDNSYKTFVECYSCQKCAPEAMLREVVRPTRMKREGEYSVTEIVSDCLLKQYYERTRNYHQKYQKYLAIFRGLSIHRQLERAFDTVEVTLYKEFWYGNEKLRLTGTFDVLAHDPDTIIEIKTIKYPLREKRPLPHHLRQVHAYATLAKFARLPNDTGYNIKNLRCVYFSDLGSIDFPIPLPDYEDFNFYLLKQCTKLHQMLKHEIPLTGTPSFLCGYCEFLDCKWRKEPKRRGMWTVREVPVRTLGEVIEGEYKELRE